MVGSHPAPGRRHNHWLMVGDGLADRDPPEIFKDGPGQRSGWQSPNRAVRPPEATPVCLKYVAPAPV